MDVHRYVQILLVPTPVTVEMDGFFLGMERPALVCSPTHLHLMETIQNHVKVSIQNIHTLLPPPLHQITMSVLLGMVAVSISVSTRVAPSTASVQRDPS